MISSYSDRPDDWTGIMLAPEERFVPLIREWVEQGWQVNVHAIGDRANRAVLDGFEALGLDGRGEGAKAKAMRPRIEHAQILTPRDLKRIVELGGESALAVIVLFLSLYRTFD